MKTTVAICLILAAATLAVYAQVVDFDFVILDDEIYVTGNRHVRDGLTAEGAAWAFTSEHGSNWHPLTGLSHMADCTLFGLDSGSHHAVNLAFHIANTLLLFGLLRAMTGAAGRSALVAAFFALHPLHVESVAWVSERKDVLSTLLWIATMWFYTAYARRGGAGRYLLTLLFFALGLMAKPMLVTLPLVLLLADFWPLERTGKGSVSRLLVEKIPFLALSAASCAITVLVQKAGGAMTAFNEVALPARVANAVVSYVAYLADTVWPSALSIRYPHPYMAGGTPLAWWQIGGAALLLAVISLAALIAHRRRYAIVGWLWFVGTMVPVIGLVQVGIDARADRYTYVPLIGIFIILVWGAGDLLARRRLPRLVPIAAATAMCVILAVLAWMQTGYWKNSESLFSHALESTERNWKAHHSLGNTLVKSGRNEEALAHYAAALKINPIYPSLHYDRGVTLAALGRLPEAAASYREALRLDGGLVEAANNLGSLLLQSGQADEAVAFFRRAVEIDPAFPDAAFNLGIALERQGRSDEAIRVYTEALQKTPRFMKIHLNLGVLLWKKGELAAAEKHLSEAAAIDPDSATAQYNLGLFLAAAGRYGEAEHRFAEVLRIDPGNAQARQKLDQVKRLLRQ